MKTSVKQKNSRSIPPTAERYTEKSIRSEAIRARARDILNSMPKELKELCDELAKV